MIQSILGELVLVPYYIKCLGNYNKPMAISLIAPMILIGFAEIAVSIILIAAKSAKCLIPIAIVFVAIMTVLPFSKSTYDGTTHIYKRTALTYSVELRYDEETSHMDVDTACHHRTVKIFGLTIEDRTLNDPYAWMSY